MFCGNKISNIKKRIKYEISCFFSELRHRVGNVVYLREQLLN